MKRINQLIQACPRDAFVGIGKPEPSHILVRGPMKLIAAQAVRPINGEAAQAERRWFESGHPLIRSALGFVSLQAINTVGTLWQHARL